MANEPPPGYVTVHVYVEMQRLMMLELRAADQKAIAVALDATKAAHETTKYRSWFILTSAGLFMTTCALAWNVLK